MSDNEKRVRSRRLYWLLLVVLVIIFAVVFIRETVIFWLNLHEFGELFIKPIYFGLLGGLVLATLTVFRVDFKNRRSIIWWAASLIFKLIRSRGVQEKISPVWFEFESFRLPHLKFLIWQTTKVLVSMFFFTNVMFGMAVNAAMLGWETGLERIPTLFALPFTTPPLNMTYAEAHVIPLMPSLTLLVPPALFALWIRLILLVLITEIARIMAPLIATYVFGMKMPSLSQFASKVEALVAAFLAWIFFSMFFSSFIDYNTRYVIAGIGAAGVVLAAFAFLDRKRGEIGAYVGFRRRQVYIRIGTFIIIAIAVGSVMLINNSIADVRKLEMLGPYIDQLISVNRYLAELNEVHEVPYEFGLTSIPPDQIDGYIARYMGFLDKVRLWDHGGSFDKLRPEIGLTPYVDFAEADILRFNGSLHWSASMDLILPTTVRQEDRWYATHFLYTHVPNGYLMLDAHTGKIVNAGMFFQQRKIYYGEGGLFRETWVAYPVGRSTSDEVEGHFYSGKGGIDISPPLTWIFEPNFFLSYPTATMRVLRYRDVYDRMRLLFPYFTYEFRGERVDMWPVTNGKQTFWAMPLIVFLDAKNVPWSDSLPLARLVGYALIDVYDGDIQLIILGNDYFSQLFKLVYAEYVSTSLPEWLEPQLRYPEELFEWRIDMYNFFHVTDPAAFIAAREFFVVPEGLDTYYILAQPPGFKELEFIGLLSLELRGALGENLAGYMVVRNDYPHTGEMFFYQVPLQAETKLLGPTAVNEALARNPDFAQLETLLRNPRIGNQIFYRIGDYDVFFIPVYTAPGGGVVTQLGTIATVGADFAGEYYVGLGSTPEESFRTFLAKTAGIEVPPPSPVLSEEERIANMIDVFEKAGLRVLTPTDINADVSFIEGTAKYLSDEDWVNVQSLLESFLELSDGYDVSRVFMWKEDGKVNFGVIVSVEGVLELHYITVNLT